METCTRDVCALREIRGATDWRRRAKLVLDPVSHHLLSPPAASSPCAHRFSLSPLVGWRFFLCVSCVCVPFFSARCCCCELEKSDLRPICASPDLVGLGLCAEVRRRASGHHLHTTDARSFFPLVPERGEKGYCVHDLCGPDPDDNINKCTRYCLSLSVFVFKLCPSIVIDLFMSGY